MIESNAVSNDEIYLPSVLVEQPERLPITELRDGESIEIPVTLNTGSVLEVYRWGVFNVATQSAPSGLYVELLNGNDMVVASENTVDNRDSASPIASANNSSSSLSIFKLRAKNKTGTPIDEPGVGCHFSYRVVQ